MSNLIILIGAIIFLLIIAILVFIAISSKEK